MAQMDNSQLPVHPSPVLTDAVLKVEQVVARLQDLQTTISGLHLSPVNPKHTRSSRTNASNRVLSSKECPSVINGAGSSRHREEYRRKEYKPGSKLVQPEQPLKSRAGRNQWPSPANQVHDVISEILMASQFAKQIATLVAEALQDGPQTTRPKGRACKDAKRRDIAFPSKAQVQKSMSAKAPPSKSFKVVPAAKPSRPLKLEASKRRTSRGYWSSSSSSPPSRRQSPERKRRSQRLLSSPEPSFRDSGDADDELSYLSTNVTEIRRPAKPWKLTPTRGVLFSNPVYSCSPTRPSSTSAPRPSPVKMPPTSGRRRSLLPEPDRRESSPKRRNNASVVSSISKAAPASGLAGHRVRKPVVEMIVPHERSTTMSEVLKVRMPLNANNDRTNDMAKDSHSHSHDKGSVNGETLAVSGDVEACDKENAPVPSCAPAVMFLRSMSGAHSLNRTLSRKNSGGSLFRRAKGWMSSQAIRHGRGLELER